MAFLIGTDPGLRQTRTPTTDNLTDGVDFTANSSTTITLSQDPGNENHTDISFDGLEQHRNTYTVSGTTVTFDAVIPTGVVNIQATYTVTVASLTVPDGSVTTSKIVDGAITAAKLAANAVPLDTGALTSQGTITTGTFTPDSANGTNQSIINGGAFTLAPQTSNGVITLFVTNNASAGAIDTSAFGRVVGDSLTTVDADDFVFTIVQSTGGAKLNVEALSIAYGAATGGTVTTDGNFKVHTFNSSGTLTFSKSPTSGVQYLVLAGGGGGGGYRGGGGGAGGYRTGTGFAVTETSYAITVGAGSAGAAYNTQTPNGSDSTFSTITSAGGGGAAGGTASASGSPGGSGAGSADSIGGATGGAATPPGQGFAGGTGGSGSPHIAGGGGGASEVGGDAISAGLGTAGSGGDGLFSSITGSSIQRGGGGGGGVHTPPGTVGLGGAGGGGAGALTGNGNAGTVNLGGGGGGASYTSSYTSQYGGAAGSGTVIVRYPFQAA